MKRAFISVAAGVLLALGLFMVAGGRSSDLLWLIAGLADALGFETKVIVPERPESVPATAVWAGGVDGGAWIECSLDSEKGADWCTTWDDQVGEVWARTYFVFRDTGEPAQDSDLKYSGFNGMYIGLADGRLLEPLKFHGSKEDLWDQAPIDPPRDPVAKSLDSN